MGNKRKDLDLFTIQDGFVFRDHLLYVPEGPCCTRVLRECHDDPLVVLLASQKPSN
jgi:hypothetical protein